MVEYDAMPRAMSTPCCRHLLPCPCPPCYVITGWQACHQPREAEIARQRGGEEARATYRSCRQEMRRLRAATLALRARAQALRAARREYYARRAGEETASRSGERASRIRVATRNNCVVPRSPSRRAYRHFIRQNIFILYEMHRCLSPAASSAASCHSRAWVFIIVRIIEKRTHPLEIHVVRESCPH